MYFNRAKRCFAHYGSPLLIFATLIAGMTEQVRAEEIPVECRLIEKQRPSDDVTYQAGVDAYGREVAPADLNAQNITVPDVIKVPLSINLAERLNGFVEGLDLEAPLGMLEISNDGHVRYNGEDISAPVATFCGVSHEVVVEEEKPISVDVAPSVEDRLEGQDVIQSADPVQEVAPVVAIPPQEVNIDQVSVEPEIDALEKNEVIEGGEYREIFYNE